MLLGKGKDAGDQSSKGEDQDSSSEEEDFMSDSFLTGANNELGDNITSTYSEKRRRQLNQARDRGKIQNRAEREKEAREIGLSRNLMAETGKKRGLEEEKESENVQSNKALKMMMAMGYQHGKGLGRSDAVDSPSEGQEKEKQVETEIIQDTKSKIMIEPLAIDERWLGAKARAGIGNLSTLSAQALSRDISKATSKEATAKIVISEEELFRQRTRKEHNIRHFERLLVDARSTCEDLDRKLGMQFSPLWLNPESLSKAADQLPPHIASLIEFAFQGLGDTMTDEDEQREAIARAQESKEFCQLPSKARLEITLSHLRRAHSYCLYCGCKYESLGELNTQCPGEEEDDH